MEPQYGAQHMAYSGPKVELHFGSNMGPNMDPHMGPNMRPILGAIFLPSYLSKRRETHSKAHLIPKRGPNRADFWGTW
jgi:hypothetical protein